MNRRSSSWILTLLLCAGAPHGCQRALSGGGASADPAEAPVSLGSMAGWDAFFVHQSDVGVWTVRIAPVYSHYGSPQIVALDDKGRCTILSPYSGRWTSAIATQDGTWLGGITHADVDPRRKGAELYVGAKRGNIYQIVSHVHGGFDSNVIAHIPGREVHTLVAADLDPTTIGVELLAFTNPGGLYLLTPEGASGSGFTCRQLEDLPGRVRDAALVRIGGLSEGEAGAAQPGVLTVSSDGSLSLLRLSAGRPEVQTWYRTGTGLGRLAVRPCTSSENLVAFVTADDGRIIRIERSADGDVLDEVIFAGPQGPRGIAVGRFHEDPAMEAVVIFGYSGLVQLLTRKGGSWSDEVIFRDLDKGHWLTAGELDERNSTEEIIISGFSGRVVLLCRPPAPYRAE